MSNNRQDQNIANATWANMQNSFIDCSTMENSSMTTAPSIGSVEGQRYIGGGASAYSSNQLHNDMLYSATPGATTSSSIIYQQQQQQQLQQQQQQQPPERYSVLPVGHGNFLKVYHTTPENNEQQSFNNYELFSNSSFITANPISIHQQSAANVMNYGGIGDIKKNFDTNDNTTNMIINQLVTNWSPNLSGTYSPFGEQQQQHHHHQQQQQQHQQQQQQHQQQQQQHLMTKHLHHHFIDSSNTQKISTTNNNYNDVIINQNQSHINNNNNNNQKSINSSLSKTNGNLENNNSSLNANVIVGQIPNNVVEVKKQRIVAEVKPMRMSYSDVLSKNVPNPNNKANNNTNGITTNTTSINSNTMNLTSSNNETMNQSRNKILNDTKTKIGISNDKKTIIEDNLNKQQRKIITDNAQLHQQRNDEQQHQQKDKKKLLNGTENSTSIKDDLQWKNNKKSLNNTMKSSTFVSSSSSTLKQKNLPNANIDNNTLANNNKKRTFKKDNIDENYDNRTNSTTTTTSTTKTNNNNDKDGLYNVTPKNDYNMNNNNNGLDKKTSLQYTNSKSTIKSKLSLSSSSSSTTTLNSKNITNSGNIVTGQRFEKQFNKRNYQKHQRGGGGGSGGGGGGGTGGGNNGNTGNIGNIKLNHLITKFFEKWLEYTIKIISWLFYLIYDVIVLGFSMLYERFYQFYDLLHLYFITIRNDFKNNSTYKLWIKNLFKKFDMKFKKNSKLAFWRKFYNNINNSNKKNNKQQNGNDTTNTNDFYKNGRLPQTGDEAMYSLLNCKGKDAYSILGVTADSSQEQIRKHYKKIAVLVHPDKNKQPGAEEAFKVLQRAFELIGEPENRKKYDQSLAEALNAEKAWTELHDLLSQLQSKIAEAANTIRCSSCGLRHPRKLTERPHYAARECSSCKIRHSAREGDIWAESSIFGLRWKYLALMEGKVYDITEWANCQKGALSQLQPNSHIVQYRIVRGGQQQQQQQQQSYNSQQQSSQQDKERLKKEMSSEPSLDEFLDNLYSGQNPQNQQQNSSRKRTKRN